MPKIIIVGIGNRYRGDDAAGWAVLDALEEKLRNRPAVIKLCKSRGDIAELIDIFASHDHVYLVDACTMEDANGKWQRIDVSREQIEPDTRQTSTHGFGVSQAVELAKNLDQLPAKLIIYAISGTDYRISDKLSPSVAQTIEKAADAILKEKDIETCMNMPSSTV